MSKEEMVDIDYDTHDDDYLEFLGEVHEAFDLDPLHPITEIEEYEGADLWEQEVAEGWKVEGIVVDGFVRDFIWRFQPG
jgi:hypothetical protein